MLTRDRLRGRVLKMGVNGLFEHRLSHQIPLS